MGNWGHHEIEKLKLFYKQFNVPTDQIVKDNNILEKFTSRFNTEIDNNFSPKEVADQLFTLRKTGNLPRIRK
jgi:hypothetical protein